MPIITRFYGIIIKMYFQQNEYNPPHFHVEYGEFVGAIEIKTLKLIDGYLPPKALVLAKEWAEQHQNALLKIWETQEFIKLPPLE